MFDILYAAAKLAISDAKLKQDWHHRNRKSIIAINLVI